MRRFLRPKYEQLTDEQLIDLYLKQSDERALNKLIERYLPKVFYFALSILKNQMDAEDAAMEVWSKLKENLAKYKINNFSSWLMKVVKTQCLKTLGKRLKERTENLDEKNGQEFVEFPFFNALEDESTALELLSKAVDTLKEEQNRCIVAFYFQSMSYQEIADEEGFSLNEVKSHIQNGRRNLKMQLTTK
ncbi:MAG: sigma-70 family RNA polymerase sigma factor [Mameliella sp.]|nr:sigma-70 family RNA polymerase sigma factor [Phaeodactylibacter sp.]NRA49841.1 sigma-70 family RNA polymerase sigma factor [Phaeodactylibacter sp.]